MSDSEKRNSTTSHSLKRFVLLMSDIDELESEAQNLKVHLQIISMVQRLMPVTSPGDSRQIAGETAHLAYAWVSHTGRFPS